MNNYLNQLFNLEGKVAALTGGGGYLCGEMARGFAKAGMKVAVIDVRVNKASAVVESIKSAGGEAIAIQTDVCEKEQLRDSLNQILENFGDVHVLVNGAGINAPTPVLDITADEWDKILAVNLRGTLFGCQIFGEYMLSKGKGSIINISSVSANPPLSKAVTYSVSKAGVKNLTQNLAREWATRGVRVNALHPGFFPTGWSKKNFITPERERAILGHTPMNRYGEPHELLGAVLWLASDASSFVTGAEIVVDGGFTAMTI